MYGMIQNKTLLTKLYFLCNVTLTLVEFLKYVSSFDGIFEKILNIDNYNSKRKHIKVKEKEIFA